MRRRRIIRPGVRYDIIARINRDEQILSDTAFKKLFLDTIRDAKKRHSFSIENICILDSIIKMIILPGSGSSLSRIMQWILSVFAIRYNRIREIHGHVWYDRFKSSIIDDIKSFLECFYGICSSYPNMIKSKNEQYHGMYMFNNEDYTVVEKPPDYIKDTLKAILHIFSPQRSSH